MKREEIRLPRHFWRWRIALFVLIMHIGIYGLMWVSAISRALRLTGLEGGSLDYIYSFQNQILPALVWLPIFLIHVGVHLYLAGRSDAGAGERQAYREGFRDGARYSSDDVYELRQRRHLEIDEDGELVEFPPEAKQKRRER